MVGTGEFLVIDKGADRQIVPGQRLTIFRASPRSPRDPVTRLGEAVAVLVDSTSATVQVIQAREPIRPGDLVAVHRKRGCVRSQYAESRRGWLTSVRRPSGDCRRPARRQATSSPSFVDAPL